MPKSQRPDGAVTGSNKRLASRFYQMKTGHCLSGQYLHYLHWTKNQPTPQCWWCGYRIQTREHLFKERPESKAQQKTLWVEVWKETGKWKSRWGIRGLLADGRCSQAVLDFLSSTDAGSGCRQRRARWARCQRRSFESGSRGEGRGAGHRGGESPLFLPTPDFMSSREE